MLSCLYVSNRAFSMGVSVTPHEQPDPADASNLAKSCTTLICHPSPLCRYKLFSEALAAIEAQGGGLDRFSRGWEYFGFNRTVVSTPRSLQVRRPATTVPGAAAPAYPTLQTTMGALCCLPPWMRPPQGWLRARALWR